MLSDYHYNTHTVLDLFKDGVKKYGNKVLLNHHNGTQWESFTWNQVDTMVKALASYFIDLGLKPGDVVSIYSENRPEWAIADLATLSIG
ncbi:MAG TPA: AMP-binding protein, partial [Spirochaetota bacterium]|nr:AMP-binding protein [Spirochaetota bacterium]